MTIGMALPGSEESAFIAAKACHRVNPGLAGRRRRSPAASGRRNSDSVLRRRATEGAMRLRYCTPTFPYWFSK
jgi:hypothetical protein